MKRVIVLLTLVALPVIILAQTSGKMTGEVKSTDGTPLAGATLYWRKRLWELLRMKTGVIIF